MSSLVKSFVNLGSQSKAKPQDDMCEICGQRPKFVESSGHQHPFCSRKCATNVSQPVACALRGCRATGNRAAFAGYCSDVHAREGIRLGQLIGCTQCKTQPATIGDLCVTCERRARAAPRLGVLDSNDVIFKSITDQYLREWTSPSSAVSIKKIYQVTNPRDVLARNDAYRRKIAAMGLGVLELRTFHSSQCICDLGVGDAVLCNFQACGICNIVKSSFRAFAFGVPQNIGRYGSGIYSYPNPALADEHSTSCTSSPYRVMIACDIVVSANGKKRRGADSINDGERIFVNNPDAIVASYIILYTK